MSTRKPIDKRVGDIDEFDLIDHIVKSSSHHPLVELGNGDDACSISVPSRQRLVASTDLLVEDIHFRRTTTSARDLGHKALAVNLSDLAAMGAEPVAALVALSVPSDLSMRWITDLYSGLKTLAKKHGVELAGGDTTGSPGPISITVTVMGVVDRKQILTRAGARAGDSIWVWGGLGLSRAGLELLESGATLPTGMRRAHLKPVPLIEQGRWLAQSGGCTACIDVSDGLLGDLGHICEQSGVGANIEETRLVVPRELKRYAATQQKPATDYVLRGGEDYALLFTWKRGRGFPSEWPERLSKPTCIGYCTSEEGIWLVGRNASIQKITAKGFCHFG